MPELVLPETIRIAFTPKEISVVRDGHGSARQLVLERFAELQVDPMDYILLSKKIVSPSFVHVLNLKRETVLSQN